MYSLTQTARLFRVLVPSRNMMASCFLEILEGHLYPSMIYQTHRNGVQDDWMYSLVDTVIMLASLLNTEQVASVPLVPMEGRCVAAAVETILPILQVLYGSELR